MVSEFDLACTNCGNALLRRSMGGADGPPVTVAVCRACSSRHYPEDALRALASRMRTEAR